MPNPASNRPHQSADPDVIDLLHRQLGPLVGQSGDPRLERTGMCGQRDRIDRAGRNATEDRESEIGNALGNGGEDTDLVRGARPSTGEDDTQRVCRALRTRAAQISSASLRPTGRCHVKSHRATRFLPRPPLVFSVGMRFVIPEAELRFRATRAGGPGGQHVNTTSTRIAVLWDVTSSPSLTDEQRQRLLEQLRNRMDSAGVLSVVAGERRSQKQNREAAVARMHELVNDALKVPRPRRKTKPPKGAAEARLAAKKRRADVKKQRKPVDPSE